MAYTRRNFRSKKALKEALANGESVGVWQPGPFGPHVPDGTVYLEGPHYPEPHKWWASGVAKNGFLIKVS